MIDTLKFTAAPGTFRDKIFEKKQICLHFTAGSTAAGCAASFRKSGAGTAYIIDRDGKIYQWFDPRYWDSHIYRHKDGEDKRLYELEKATIGIEVVNIAYLVLGKGEKDKDVLYTYTKKPFCKLSDTDKYVQTTYRGQHYWQTFTEGQYAALRYLLPLLRDQFMIDFQAPAPKGYPRLNAWDLDTLMGYRGLTTHANYRSDKYDIGPAFDWTRIGVYA